jgi:hypothetical protein
MLLQKTITTDTVTKVKTTTYVPEMQLNLNKTYFKTRIIGIINSGKLANNDVFKIILEVCKLKKQELVQESSCLTFKK